MPKSLIIDPAEVRAAGSLQPSTIAINQYRRDFEQERRRWGDERLLAIYRDMVIIREFEQALLAFKTTGAWQGVEYRHNGPMHPSIGEEASAVGVCLDLDQNDLIFGSHRSHGEILAKCFSSARRMDEGRLTAVMEEYHGGDILRVVEAGYRGDLWGLMERFVIYGALAEIFGRSTGFNHGLGGSMHAFFQPFGSMPNNAIVGGSAAIALGAALFKRINRRSGIVIANIGDASMSCGPVWEALTMASMAQYRTLWDKTVGGAPPILFNVVNNFYGMGGQPQGETMGQEILARIGAGVNPDQMHAERVDGYNPLAVADAVYRKKRLLLDGRGPALLDTISYRISGHSANDASSYRTREEIERWQEINGLRSYGDLLVENGLGSAERLQSMREEIVDRIGSVAALAVSSERSPRVDGAFIEGVMFSNQTSERLAEESPETLLPQAETSRVKALRTRSRRAFDSDGAPLPLAGRISYRDALFEAMIHRFYVDPTMIAFGEENRDWGGAFAIYRGLTEALPYHRLFNAPIAEAAIVGSGVGYAISGGRAVVELMYGDFIGRAGDEIFNQMAKWQAMSGGLLRMPLIVRVSVGSAYGAQHSQDWSAIIAHLPGLKGMYPSTPYDAKGMLNRALRGSDPVFFFESQKLYNIGERFAPDGVPEGYYEVPEGLPALRRSGDDITIVTLGPSLYTALDAAEELQRGWQLEAEVIDLRFINPIDYTPILESVRKTGRILLVSEAVERGSLMQTVAAEIGRLAFDDLDAPPIVLGSRNWITPAVEMEALFFPQPNWIVDCIHEQIVSLAGHSPTTVAQASEWRRRSRLGV